MSKEDAVSDCVVVLETLWPSESGYFTSKQGDGDQPANDWKFQR